MLDLYSYVYNYDPDSTQRIAKSTIDHNLSLNRCADIIELMALAVDLLGPEDAIAWLKNALVEEDLLAN